MNRASVFAPPPRGFCVHRAAAVFLSAVLAVLPIGATPAGAADEPVATAPIPPPPPARPPAPDTPLMVPATPPAKPDSTGTKTDAPKPAAGLPNTKRGTAAAAGAKRQREQRTDTAAHGGRPKAAVPRHTATRKTSRRKLAAERAGSQRAAAGEAAVAAAAEAAGREASRRRAAQLGHDGYHGARPAPAQGLTAPPPWTPPPYDMPYAGAGPDRPDRSGGGRPRSYAEYPAPPMLYGPAYPPPWYNAPRPEYYPERWHRGPMAPW